MPRKTRVHYRGALYHVIVRGNNRQYIFESNKMKGLYLKKVKTYIDKYDCKLYAYAIMDNHAHLLIEVDDIPLSKPMQLIQQTFTQHYNKVNERTGHVFEQRYKSILCDKDQYLLTLIKYIHNNPVRAGIADIDYRWSSHREYKTYTPIYCDIYFPMSIFSTKKNEAISKYLKFMEQEDIIECKSDYEFIPNENITKYNKELNFDLTYEELLNQFINKYEIIYEDLMGRAKNRKTSKIKEKFVKTVIKNKLMSQRELADRLKVSEQTISRIVNKV
ncbi:transposase [Clostridiisalibacter paucivorans]|uniref:transposase n=1 Tax=Clostridiisalibacter paucivorans TaxID=408753 RepID=UPI0006861E9E|nr:transposase [Clostridiisalibacter paucivorans]